MKFCELFTKLMRERGQSDRQIFCALVGQEDYEVTPEEEIAMTKFADVMCMMPTEAVKQIGQQLDRKKAAKN